MACSFSARQERFTMIELFAGMTILVPDNLRPSSQHVARPNHNGSCMQDTSSARAISRHQGKTVLEYFTSTVIVSPEKPDASTGSLAVANGGCSIAATSSHSWFRQKSIRHG